MACNSQKSAGWKGGNKRIDNAAQKWYHIFINWIEGAQYHAQLEEGNSEYPEYFEHISAAVDSGLHHLVFAAETALDYYLAAGILALSALTDLADGKIARRFHMITNLGKILDPVADKATQGTLLICLALRHPVLWYVLALFFVKEGFMLVMGVINLRKKKMLNGALMTGKVCTTVLFISMILLVLFPDISDGATNLLVALCVACMILSLIDYIVAYLGPNKKVRDLS